MGLGLGLDVTGVLARSLCLAMLCGAVCIKYVRGRIPCDVVD